MALKSVNKRQRSDAESTGKLDGEGKLCVIRLNMLVRYDYCYISIPMSECVGAQSSVPNRSRRLVRINTRGHRLCRKGSELGKNSSGARNLDVCWATLNRERRDLEVVCNESKASWTNTEAFRSHINGCSETLAESEINVTSKVGVLLSSNYTSPARHDKGVVDADDVYFVSLRLEFIGLLDVVWDVAVRACVGERAGLSERKGKTAPIAILAKAERVTLGEHAALQFATHHTDDDNLLASELFVSVDRLWNAASRCTLAELRGVRNLDEGSVWDSVSDFS